ncbi:MAG TPA: DUF6443 domain-containing protein [Chitinophaga sp.]|uniref:DUF6443 domain-containing protein n=1 Tax=Chitinophaga sp. TaxID=1869181 RepID=UPI002BAD4536|nr:DUF6443 domain-containing protein [Chitinophaga sp.]HVI48697.1 DUF6443 domain-containing protein [Chitinophaga sp.]
MPATRYFPVGRHINSNLKRACKAIAVIAFFVYAGALSAQNIPNGSIRPAAGSPTVPAAYTGTTINYIRTWDPSMPSSDIATVTASTNVRDVKQTTQYFDGLGRPLQTVARGLSAGGKDLVTPVTFDEFGREQFKYLPYTPKTGNSSDGKFKTDPFNGQKAFYEDAAINPGTKDESIFYSQIEYEASPLNRPLNTYSAGNSWAKTGGNHPVKLQYLVSSVSDSVRIWTMSGNSVVSSATYGAGQLYKNVTVDEAGNQAVEYKDKEGHAVLKKVQIAATPGTAHMGWLCTYYIYDDQNNLRFVIPPLAVEKITTSWNVAAVTDELCFQYRYDGRNRMIMKKVPGSDSTEMVYDVRDRLVFVRDRNLKDDNRWLVTFYDALNRPVETALYNSTATRDALQTSMNSALTDGSTSYQYPGIRDLVAAIDDRPKYVASNSVELVSGFETATGGEREAYIDAALAGGSINITVSNPLPGIAPQSLTPLTYTFYDRYNYDGVYAAASNVFNSPQAGLNSYAEGISISNVTPGLVTGTKVRVLGTDQWLTTTTYYNDKGRPVQIISDNAAGGKDTLTTLYDFNGKVLSTYLRHTNPRSGVAPWNAVLTMMGYDDAGRLVSVKKRLNDNAATERTVATSDYDELGQVRTKALGLQTGGAAIEQLSFEYNIRGWLKSINKDYLNNGNNVSHFGQEMSYDYGFTSNVFNGNTAGIRWKGWNDKTPRAYGYSYDKAHRLTKGDFSQQASAGAPWTNANVNFSMDELAYDANGNITRLFQWGMNGTAKDQIDQLTYRYKDNSNKLLAVTDANQLPLQLGDFKDGNKTGNDYDYDPNGNLKKDLNKSITAITYNHLNLPEQVVSAKGIIDYLYDAAGIKVQKTVTDKTVTPNKVTVTSYTGGFVYQNDTLQFLGHEEGRIRLFLKTGQTPQYVYDYFVKDHLGNVRLVLTEHSDLSVYAATMEAPLAAKENALFSNIDATRAPKPVGYPADNSTSKNESVARLNAKDGGKKIGPSIVLRVMAGDTIQIGAKAFYKSQGPGEKKPSETTAENMVADLLQVFGGNAATAGEHNVAAATAQTPFNTNFYNNDYRKLKEKDPNQNRSDKPKAYLNFALFDDQFKLVDENSGVKQVKGEADQLQTLAVDKMPIKKSGFLYVYTSNETAQDVFFDDVVVTQATGNVVEETHYYPLGVTMAGISSNALLGKNYPENRLKYNGKELQSKEFGDGSGLDWYDYGARMFDVQIGRFMTVDPLTEKNLNMSPYVYAFNNAVNVIDPDGRDGIRIIDRDNKTITIRATYYVQTEQSTYFTTKGQTRTLDGYSTKEVASMQKNYNEYLNDLKLSVSEGEYSGYTVKFDLQFKSGGTVEASKKSAESDKIDGNSIGNSFAKGSADTYSGFKTKEVEKGDETYTTTVGGITIGNNEILMNKSQDGKMNRIHEIFHTFGFNHPKGAGGNNGIMKYPPEKPNQGDVNQLGNGSFLPKKVLKTKKEEEEEKNAVIR